jgi:hypothetical protein
MLDHPLVPGDTSAIEKGPWHYGADYVTVYFSGNPTKMKEMVPPPFNVTDGTGLAYVCEIVSVSDSDAGMVSRHPERTLYQEAAIGLKCQAANKQGVFYPVMWVSTEWALLRGLLNGYQKRLADTISLTKLHPLNPGLKQVGPGSTLSGFCVKGAGSCLSVGVTLKHKGEPGDLPTFGATFGRRAFPRTDSSQREVMEPVEILKSNQKTSNVWLGDGYFETALDLGETMVTLGATYSSGFTIGGSRVLTSDRNV